MEDWKPAPYAAFMHRNGKQSRVGNYATLEKARKAIDLSEENRRDTLGGLFAPDNDKVTYSIWVAEWTEVK